MYIFLKRISKNSSLHPVKSLSQEGEFASEETLTLINKDKKLEKIRIIGPLRKHTQIEISITDAFELKLDKLPPLRVSGDLANAEKIILQGSKGKIETKSLIIAKRHLHISEEEAKKLNLKNEQIIKIKTDGDRGLTFNNIIVRINKDYRLSLHLDTDEGNAAGINMKTSGEIVK